MRGAALLVLAGLAVAFAPGRLEPAVHPGEVSRRGPAREFERASALLPPLDSLRIHSDDPELGTKLRRVRARGRLGTIVEVAEVERSLARGVLSGWDPSRLDGLLVRMRGGEDPRVLAAELPPAPDARPYFRDAEGPFACEILNARAEHVPAIREAIPDAELRGEPVERAAERRHAKGIGNATIAALLATAIGLLAAGGWRGRGPWEWRVLAMAAPVALLGWASLGIDVWTIPAIVLAGTARSGPPLLAGAALMLSPVLAMQRIAIVLGLAGLLRLRERAPGSGAEDGAHARRRAPVAWALVPLAALVLSVAYLTADPAASGIEPPDGSGEPVAAFVPAERRAEAAARFARETSVVGGETVPDARADLAAQHKLARIFRHARSAARTAEGAERAAWDRIAAASAREAVAIPRGLRARRESRDGRAVLWLQEPTEPGQVSYRTYRASSRRILDDAALGCAWLLFAILAFVRLGRGAPSIRDGLGPLLAFVVAAVILPRHGLAPVLPVFAVAVFVASWLTPIALAAAAAFLVADLWVAVLVFGMASAAAYRVGHGRERPIPTGGPVPAVDSDP